MSARRRQFPKNVEKKDDDIILDALQAKIEADDPTWRAAQPKKVKDALGRRDTRRKAKQ